MWLNINASISIFRRWPAAFYKFTIFKNNPWMLQLLLLHFLSFHATNFHMKQKWHFPNNFSVNSFFLGLTQCKHKCSVYDQRTATSLLHIFFVFLELCGVFGSLGVFSWIFLIIKCLHKLLCAHNIFMWHRM